MSLPTTVEAHRLRAGYRVDRVSHHIGAAKQGPVLDGLQVRPAATARQGLAAYFQGNVVASSRRFQVGHARGSASTVVGNDKPGPCALLHGIGGGDVVEGVGLAWGLPGRGWGLALILFLADRIRCSCASCRRLFFEFIERSLG